MRQSGPRPRPRAAAHWSERGSARAIAYGWLRKHAPVVPERGRDVVEQLQPAAGEDGGAVAILPDGMAVVRRQDDIRAAQALAKCGRIMAAKPFVADLGDFVDQVDVEVDRQARAEGEPGAHPRRIG